MMDKSAALKELGGFFREVGLQGHTRHFFRLSTELNWYVDLESIPRSDRIAIKVGVCPSQLAPHGLPKKANDCPVIFSPEGSDEPFGIDRWRVWAAFDLSTPLDDETRSDEFKVIAGAIVTLIDQVGTVAALRQMAANGRVSGFMRKDARELLIPGA